MRGDILATSAAAMALLIATGVSAQQTNQRQQPQTAEQCMADIRDFGQQSAETGYGVVGPPGYGMQAPAGGWYGTYGPRREMNALLMAADVLARNGREEACQTVLTALRDIRDQRRANLEQAGVAPEEMQTWRQERLVTAQPVEELGGTIRIENILGADLRNLQDEDLGDIEDVVLDDKGDLADVLVQRGGFFGIDGALVPVRWQDLRAVPDLDTFVSTSRNKRSNRHRQLTGTCSPTATPTRSGVMRSIPTGSSTCRVDPLPQLHG